jgi:NADH:ubiquinone oxidoreductase subunit 3 (subunit A)
MNLRELYTFILTEIYFDFCSIESTFNQTISQQLLSPFNLEEDYLFFLKEYLHLLVFFKKTMKFFLAFWLFDPFAEEEFIESQMYFLGNFPGMMFPIIQDTKDIMYMETTLAENYMWFRNFCFFIPLIFIFLKSIIQISIISFLTLEIVNFEYLFSYFNVLYQLVFRYDTIEDLYILFNVFDIYNFNLILNIIFFSLKYNIYPLFTVLDCKSEYFFIPLGIFIDFLFAFLLLFIVYTINRGTIISDLEKTSAYECGFDPFKDSRQLTDINFFRVAILFILFDLEIIYLIPWIFILYSSFYNYYIIIGGFSYLFVLTLGLFFEYKSKMLDW